MKQKLRELNNSFSHKLFGGILILIGSLIAFVYGLEYAVGDVLTNQAQNVFITISIIVFAVVLTYVIKMGLGWIQAEDVLGPHQQELAYRFSQITVYIASLLLLLDTWDIDLANLLLGAGVLGILVGFAARQALSSVLAGIIIMSTNMFRINQWVSFEDKYGQITKITFFNTHMTSPQGETHIIPNDSLTSKNVTNMSDRPNYRNDLLISVDYEANLDHVLTVCDAELDKLADADDGTEEQIVSYQKTSIKEFNDSGIDLSIKVWIKNPTPHMINQTQTTVLKQLHNRFQREDIDIPFPQVTVSERSQQATDQPENTRENLHQE